MIFDEIAEVMNSEPARKVSKKTGLSRGKISCMVQRMPFVLDLQTTQALEKMGYTLVLIQSEKLSNEMAT